jgi:hypothetical protein
MLAKVETDPYKAHIRHTQAERRIFAIDPPVFNRQSGCCHMSVVPKIDAQLRVMLPSRIRLEVS